MLLALLTLSLGLPAADSAHIVLVATSDIRGHVTGWDYPRNAPDPGGLARAATVVDSLRDRYPGGVVLLDAGNLLEGDAFATYFAWVVPREINPAIDVMNFMGYDAATLGRHDFDFGLRTMDEALAAASFPYVSGNIVIPPKDTLAFPPYAVVQRRGVRIGVTGFTTPGVMVWNADQVRGRLRVKRIQPSVDGVLRELRRDTDFSVALVQSGMDGPSSYDTTGVGPENQAATLAASAWKPDVVIGGQTNREMRDTVVNGVHFMQPRPFGQGVAVIHVDLVRAGTQWKPIRIRGELLALATANPSPRVARRLAELHGTVLAWMETIIGQAEVGMSALTSRVQDTPVIQFINDVQRRTARTDLSATTVFDVQAGFREGDITNGDVLALYPHDYTLVGIRISGEQLKAYLEQSGRYFVVDSTGRIGTNRYVPATSYDVVSGADYAIDLSKPPGSRIQNLLVRGRVVQPADTFTIALNNLRRTGAGGYAMIRGAPLVYDKGRYIQELLIEEVKRRETLRPSDYARTGWQIVPTEAANAARALFVRPVTPVPLAVRDTTASRIFTTPSKDSINAVLDSIEREHQRADSIARNPVAVLRIPATGAGLGNLVADGYRNTLRSDLAIVEADEMLRSLPAGPLTAPQVMAVLSGRRLLKITMSGADLTWVFEHLVEREQPCCYLSGAVVTYDSRERTLEQVREVRFADGRKLEKKRSYTLTISERLVSSGGAFILGATQCSPSLGCAHSGLLGQWVVEWRDQTDQRSLLEFLPKLPQPVTPSAEQRLIAKP